MTAPWKERNQRQASGAPRLSELRLLGGRGAAALVQPDASIIWWCSPRLDDDPQLWRLLDPSGPAAAWSGATPVEAVGLGAGPSLRSVVAVDGSELQCWDVLVHVGPHPLIVRLVRSRAAAIDVIHHVDRRGSVKLSWLHRPWEHRRRGRWSRAGRAARDRVLAGRVPSGALPLVYGGEDVDGASLLAVVLGLFGRKDPVTTRLVDATIDALGVGDPLTGLRRYPASVDDGFDGDEGAFVPVSWWAVGALAQLGRCDESHALTDRLCETLGELQGEVIAPDGEVLGNTPLVWSHAECARALYLLRVADLRRRWGTLGVALWRLGRLVRHLLRAARSTATGDREPAG